MGAPGNSSREVVVRILRTEILENKARASRAAAMLSADERGTFERLPPGAARRDYLGAHALARTTIAEQVGVEPERLLIRSSPWGRPELVAPGSHRRLSFSLSHADGIALCAVTRCGAVGADVESLRHVGPDPLGVAATICSEREREALLATPAPLRAERFLSLWTLKEAFAKATGLGFRLDLGRITLRLGPAPAPELELDPGGGAEASLWRFGSKFLEPHHVAAVAVRGAPAEEVVIRFEEVAW
ncbi:MAG: 4'-phosphopantetheinyl transferase superfamily protein [Candidatus Eisenbacteria bacterium]|uniref:4'-phosphopantetheinyl transferase superfamily protein n=1 Tax=Eiseniibacteriota bacterium TaxID=2212470 RepID=A0A538SNN1_UNCEI|nr:MAG: 4'-phosphopantetheinyl transferase superfamily protein [Candidatus Eisenbacteria bacterium]